MRSGEPVEKRSWLVYRDGDRGRGHGGSWCRRDHGTDRSRRPGGCRRPDRIGHSTNSTSPSTPADSPATSPPATPTTVEPDTPDAPLLRGREDPRRRPQDALPASLPVDGREPLARGERLGRHGAVRAGRISASSSSATRATRRRSTSRTRTGTPSRRREPGLPSPTTTTPTRSTSSTPARAASSRPSRPNSAHEWSMPPSPARMTTC